MSDLFEELKQTIQNIEADQLKTHSIVILPDFFLDHFINVNNPDTLLKDISTVNKQGGGSITPLSQRLQAGGNGANIAYHLAHLGMSPHLICTTNPLGEHLLKFFFKDLPVDLTHLKTDGQLAMTTALELGESHTNIMLSDPGSVDGFSFDFLNDSDRELIADADLVALLNWNNNKKATQLADQLFSYAHQHNTKTFLDTGDPFSRQADIAELKEKILSTPKLDYFGLNENELRFYTSTTFTDNDEMIHCAEQLKTIVPARIDLHTADLAASINDCDSIIIPTIPTQHIQRITGAGDSWTAANLYATQLGFADDQRLLFSNLYAHLYISSLDDRQLNLETLQKTLAKLTL